MRLRDFSIVHSVAVVWVAVGLLLVLKPLQLRYEHTVLQVYDVASWPRFLAALKQDSASRPAARMLLDTASAVLGDPESLVVQKAMANAVNDLLRRDDLTRSLGNPTAEDLGHVRPSPYANDLEDLSGGERQYLNRIRVGTMWSQYIAPPSETLTYDIIHGLTRRLDDPSFWALLAVAVGGSIMCISWKKKQSSGLDVTSMRDSARLRLASTLLALLFIASYLLMVASPSDRGTFFWQSPGHPYEPQIKIIQVVEGCAVILAMAATCSFLYFGGLVLVPYLRHRSAGLSKSELAPLDLLATACTAPVGAIPIAILAYRLVARWGASTWSVVPKEYDVLKYVVFLALWYLPFLLLTGGAMYVLFAKHLTNPWPYVWKYLVAVSLNFGVVWIVAE